MSINYPLIEVVLQSIRNHPDKHEQAVWVGAKAEKKEEAEGFLIQHQTIGKDEFLVATGSCKTAACIAGWTLLHQGFVAQANRDALSGNEENQVWYSALSNGEDSEFDPENIAPRAAEELGILDEECDQIFLDLNNQRAVAQLMFLY